MAGPRLCVDDTPRQKVLDSSRKEGCGGASGGLADAEEGGDVMGAAGFGAGFARHSKMLKPKGKMEIRPAAGRYRLNPMKAPGWGARKLAADSYCE